MRSFWLDTLRTTAIILVVVYHLFQASPLNGTSVTLITQHGKIGVDLFFVLSGWLVGGLFWKEFKAEARVELMRFWLRRALRTMPPYFCALFVQWLGVYLVRGERFDIGYILFVQNYYERMPFFLVSWSLCIEEHFYLFVPPLAFALVRSLGLERVGSLLVAIVFVPIVARNIEYAHVNLDEFGYAQTATHLHMDGLLVGFAMSYYRTCKTSVFNNLTPFLPWLMLAMTGISFWALSSSSRISYVVAPLTLALGLASLLAWGDARQWFRSSQSGNYVQSVRWIAMGAYSTYLTHPMALQAASLLSPRLGSGAAFAYWFVACALITCAAAAFWLLVEKPSIQLRDRMVSQARTNGRIAKEVSGRNH